MQVSERYSNALGVRKGAQLHKQTLQWTPTFLSPISPTILHSKACHTYIYTNKITVLNTLGLERSYICYQQKVTDIAEFRVPTWYLAENKEVPDRNVGVPSYVHKYAIYCTLHLLTQRYMNKPICLIHLCEMSIFYEIIYCLSITS